MAGASAWRARRPRLFTSSAGRGLTYKLTSWAVVRVLFPSVLVILIGQVLLQQVLKQLRFPFKQSLLRCIYNSGAGWRQVFVRLLRTVQVEQVKSHSSPKNSWRSPWGRLFKRILCHTGAYSLGTTLAIFCWKDSLHDCMLCSWLRLSVLVVMQPCPLFRSITCGLAFWHWNNIITDFKIFIFCNVFSWSIHMSLLSRTYTYCPDLSAP